MGIPGWCSNALMCFRENLDSCHILGICRCNKQNIVDYDDWSLNPSRLHVINFIEASWGPQ
jgi:hypothetical protein